MFRNDAVFARMGVAITMGYISGGTSVNNGKVKTLLMDTSL